MGDSDSSKSKVEDEGIANLCLMARENTGQSDELEEVTLEYLLTFTKEYRA